MTFPYESRFIGECHRNRLIEGRYRREGRGQQPRRMWVSDWRLPPLREEMEKALGPLAVFDLASAAAPDPPPSEAPAPPLPDSAAIAVMSDADKLAIRARLQARYTPPSPESAAAREKTDCYGIGGYVRSGRLTFDCLQRCVHAGPARRRCRPDVG